jgi:hypothetical protein
MKAGFKRDAADKAAHAEAEAVVQRWNDQLALGRDMLWSPTIRAALLAGTPWLDVFCPGCGTSHAIDLRKVDRHSLASVGRTQPPAASRCKFTRSAVDSLQGLLAGLIPRPRREPVDK